MLLPSAGAFTMGPETFDDRAFGIDLRKPGPFGDLFHDLFFVMFPGFVGIS